MPVTVPMTVDLGGIQVLAFRTPSLGNWSYLIASDGEAVVVDPQRDAEQYLEAARTGGTRLRRVLETHIHSDYLSGGLWLADRTGAKVIAPARGRYEFDHIAVDDGDDVAIGGMRLRCTATPGHTFDHVAWQLLDPESDTPKGVLTGGSLLIGGAGRTDLAGRAATPELTALQFVSLRRLADLSGSATVLPTHGGGSTCSINASVEVQEFTSIEHERRANPFMSNGSYEEFASSLLSHVTPAPAYFPFVAAVNREGPPVEDTYGVEPLSAGRFAHAVATGAWVIDTRNRWAFADGHIPGSLNIELSDLFATQLGSLVPYGAPLAVVIETGEHDVLVDLQRECFRLGYRIAGVLHPGIEAWVEQGFEMESYPASDILELQAEASHDQPPALLDVRDPVEWLDGSIPGSARVPVSGLADGAVELRDRWVNGSGQGRLNVACTGGARAGVAASYLARLGVPVRVILGGGVPDALGMQVSALDVGSSDS
jgi:glyoxylase-like metal-dependent hydrolase (beta-lactamase superfamily II)/rhodanese-related sulfurtransferase